MALPMLTLASCCPLRPEGARRAAQGAAPAARHGLTGWHSLSRPYGCATRRVASNRWPAPRRCRLPLGAAPAPAPAVVCGYRWPWRPAARLRPPAPACPRLRPREGVGPWCRDRVSPPARFTKTKKFRGLLRFNHGGFPWRLVGMRNRTRPGCWVVWWVG